jgi:hypothetical protein
VFVNVPTQGAKPKTLDADSQSQEARSDSYPVRDLLKALREAHYREAEAEVNLANHRRTQRWWQIIVFDWPVSGALTGHAPSGSLLRSALSAP